MISTATPKNRKNRLASVAMLEPRTAYEQIIKQRAGAAARSGTREKNAVSICAGDRYQDIRNLYRFGVCVPSRGKTHVFSWGWRRETWNHDGGFALS